MTELSYLDDNIDTLRARIEKAARECGRDAGEVCLLAAVKYADAEQINYIHKRLGVRDVGENRVQQLLEHWERLDTDGLRVHFIGSLQTNKVKYIIDKVCLIHSLDSDRLAAEIDKQAKKHGIIMDVLVEINSGNEESKGGVSPDEALDFCLGLEKYKNIRLCGFMTMAPKCEDRRDYHKYFGKTQKLCHDIWYNKLFKDNPPILSMGMSDSFEEAICNGSTIVRVGGGIFRH